MLGTGFLVSGGALALGAVSVIVAPIVMPPAAKFFKSVFRTGIKAGILAYKETEKTIGRIGDSMKDIVKEAKADLR